MDGSGLFGRMVEGAGIAVVALSLAATRGIATTGGPLTEPREELRLQLSNELEELQAEQRRNVTEYQQLQSQADLAEVEMREANRRLTDSTRVSGATSKVTKAAQEELTKARQKFYSLLNRRDHVLYQFNLVRKGILDRQYILGTNPTTQAKAAVR